MIAEKRNISFSFSSCSIGPIFIQCALFSILILCLAAADCFPGLVCTYTAQIDYGHCVQPAATGQACGVRFNSLKNNIGNYSASCKPWFVLAFFCLVHGMHCTLDVIMIAGTLNDDNAKQSDRV